MTQKEPTTLVGRCTTLANGDGHYKRCNRNQVASEFTTLGLNFDTESYSTKNNSEQPVI